MRPDTCFVSITPDFAGKSLKQLPGKEYNKSKIIFIYDVSPISNGQKFRNRIWNFIESSAEEQIRDCIREIFVESIRIAIHNTSITKFLLIGSQNNWFGSVAEEYLGVVQSAYTTRVRYGYLRKEVLDRNKSDEKLHSATDTVGGDEDVVHVASFIDKNLHCNAVLAPQIFCRHMKTRVFPYAFSQLDNDISFDASIIDSWNIKAINVKRLRSIISWMPVYNDNRFLVVLRDKSVIVHIPFTINLMKKYLLVWMILLKKTPCVECLFNIIANKMIKNIRDWIRRT
jgi:hypothetical protein